MGDVYTAWISRHGWGLAHLIAPGSEYREDHLNTEYAKTRCGRAVRAEEISAEPYADRCERCAARAKECA